MKGIITFLVALVFAGCSPDTDTEGIVYTGKTKLNTRLHQFVATHADTKRNVVLTMTGPHELTFNLNDKLSHIDYEKDVILIRSETEDTEWSAKKVKGGFELKDGILLHYGNCRDWTICLLESSTGLPVLKGKYSLQGNRVEITLWIADHENHVELLGLMTNALFNKSRDEKQSVESALETLSPQVWTY